MFVTIQNQSRTHPSKQCAIGSEHAEDFDGNGLVSLSAEKPSISKEYVSRTMIAAQKEEL
jgi:hypothetical protein